MKKWVLEKPQQVVSTMNRVQKMLRQVPAGHGQDKQDPGGAGELLPVVGKAE